MDIEKLIERLRTDSLYADKATLEIMDLCMEAADALSTLQAENERLQAELEQVKREKSRIPEGYALAKLELLEELDNFRDLGPVDRLRELSQTDKGGKIKAYIVDGFYCDICQKRHSRIKEIKVYLTRDAAKAALRREQE